jgi:hypothetical protein
MYGNPYESDGCPSSIYVSIGHGKCKCGLLSPTPLPTNADRRDWWRSHVDQVIAADTPVVLSWDYGQQPDLDELAAAIDRLTVGKLRLIQVETQSSDIEIILSTVPLDEQAVDALWTRHEGGE